MSGILGAVEHPGPLLYLLGDSVPGAAANRPSEYDEPLFEGDTKLRQGAFLLLASLFELMCPDFSSLQSWLTFALWFFTGGDFPGHLVSFGPNRRYLQGNCICRSKCNPPIFISLYLTFETGTIVEISKI